MADEQLPQVQIIQQQQQQQQHQQAHHSAVILPDQQNVVADNSIAGAGAASARNSDEGEGDEEPTKKRCRVDGTAKQPSSSSSSSSDQLHQEKLEQRLGGILCCAVCLDLPRTAIYQCTNGHLMCAGCFTHLLADARLRDELATCPNCRIEISKTNSSRNLAVEKAVNELPAECQFCAKQFSRHLLDRHQTELCVERSTTCKYHRIGCPWRGPFHERPAHEESCTHPSKSGGEVMGALFAADKKHQEETELYDKIFELLSFEKVSFNDLQLKPYRTDEFIHKLFYETSRFTAFNSQWVVKSRVNDTQRDPTQSCQRTITYQLILKSKVSGPMGVHFFVMRGPFGDMKVQPCIYYCDFSDDKNESPYYQMPLHDSDECNRLLAAKAINFRLIMFQANK